MNMQRTGIFPHLYLLKTPPLPILHTSKISIELDYYTNLEKSIDIFNRSEYFFSYDPCTFLVVIALLCGCIVVQYPVEGYTEEQWMHTVGVPTKLKGFAYGIENIGYAQSTIGDAYGPCMDAVEYSNKSIKKFLHEIQTKTYNTDRCYEYDESPFSMMFKSRSTNWILNVRQIIIYILCYDEETEMMANKSFKNFKWARIYRIKNQSHLFENVLFQSELMDLYGEWKDKEYVGTLSYSALTKIDYNGLNNVISQAMTNQYDFIPFMSTYNDNTCNSNIYLAQELKALKNNLFNFDKDFIPRYCWCNYWMARPQTMLSYIEFFNNKLLPYIENCEHVWDNVIYREGKLSRESLLALTKRVPHYPFHPFMIERVVYLIFESIGAVSPRGASLTNGSWADLHIE
jgi:hypothetical protein